MSAWIIQTTKKLWSGESLIPGTIDEMNSGTMEVCGVYTTLSFLRHYLAHYPISFSSKSTIYVCCDNKGIINCTMDPMPISLNPMQTLSDDYSIYCEIYHTQCQLKPIHLHFHHIKGHQDQTTQQQKLPIKAILNIECDTAAAKLQTQLPQKYLPLQNQPTTTESTTLQLVPTPLNFNHKQSQNTTRKHCVVLCHS